MSAPLTTFMFLALFGCVACGGDSVGYLEPYEGIPLNLLPGQTRPFAVRYTDRHGFPVAGAAIHCWLIGDPNGAVLASPVATTDGGGVARFELYAGLTAAFEVVCAPAGHEDAQLRIASSALTSVRNLYEYS